MSYLTLQNEQIKYCNFRTYRGEVLKLKKLNQVIWLKYILVICTIRCQIKIEKIRKTKVNHD